MSQSPLDHEQPQDPLERMAAGKRKRRAEYRSQPQSGLGLAAFCIPPGAILVQMLGAHTVSGFFIDIYAYAVVLMVGIPLSFMAISQKNRRMGWAWAALAINGLFVATPFGLWSLLREFPGVPY